MTKGVCETLRLDKEVFSINHAQPQKLPRIIYLARSGLFSINEACERWRPREDEYNVDDRPALFTSNTATTPSSRHATSRAAIHRTTAAQIANRSARLSTHDRIVSECQRATVFVRSNTDVAHLSCSRMLSARRGLLKQHGHSVLERHLEFLRSIK